ncbi:hypothetical protein X566_20475 [Afipia sp. P52-10]|jgi:hypothetical protein|uniref:hypothetical protein n=1 Tax=Afipia sp. P52-10 TaxID=1429916 RepID=UPI0003DF00B6|nr:hypothetical protein [Afipia sp. P52-10]ETR75115.1 hypothetical protein X566_20475 [Afipia sp. P52-10]
MTHDHNPRFHTFGLDAFGNRVRIGLTFAETLEFEYLDSHEPVDADGNPLPWELQSDAMRRAEDRWFELYRKHEAACLALVEVRRPHLARSPSLSARRTPTAGAIR